MTFVQKYAILTTDPIHYQGSFQVKIKVNPDSVIGKIASLIPGLVTIRQVLRIKSEHRDGIKSTLEAMAKIVYRDIDAMQKMAALDGNSALLTGFLKNNHINELEEADDSTNLLAAVECYQSVIILLDGDFVKDYVQTVADLEYQFHD